jgi:hypothetical protein
MPVDAADAAVAAATPDAAHEATSTTRGLRARVLAVQERAQGPVVVLQAGSLTLTVSHPSSTTPSAETYMSVYMSDPIAPCPAFAR